MLTPASLLPGGALQGLYNSGLLTGPLNSRYFSRKYTAICLSQPAGRSEPAATFPSFQPGSTAHIPATALGLVQEQERTQWLGLQILRVRQENHFVITKRLIHYLLLLKIALGQGWVKRTGKDGESHPGPTLQGTKYY